MMLVLQQKPSFTLPNPAVSFTRIFFRALLKLHLTPRSHSLWNSLKGGSPSVPSTLLRVILYSQISNRNSLGRSTVTTHHPPPPLSNVHWAGGLILIMSRQGAGRAPQVWSHQNGHGTSWLVLSRMVLDKTGEFCPRFNQICHTAPADASYDPLLARWAVTLISEP